MEIEREHKAERRERFSATEKAPDSKRKRSIQSHFKKPEYEKKYGYHHLNDTTQVEIIYLKDGHCIFFFFFLNICCTFYHDDLLIQCYNSTRKRTHEEENKRTNEANIRWFEPTKSLMLKKM